MRQVEPLMMFNAGRWLLCLLAVVWFGTGEAAGADEPTATTRDTLVYKDGDRVQGKLVERAGDTIVFRSDRFGTVRVPAADAVVILAEKPAEPAAKAATGEKAASPAVAKAEKPDVKPADTHAEQEKLNLWERFSPAQLTAAVRSFFGPWHGRLLVSTESVSDTARRSDDSVDAKIQRKWAHDDVVLTAHYDYAEASQIKTTDLLRSTGSWRHDFNTWEFVQYRPTLEWNRVSQLNGLPNQYVSLQQDIGVGFNLVTRPTRKLRAGVSENLFDVWNKAPTPNHTSHAVESLFEEVEWTLPWRMKLTQRAVWYPVFGHQPDGWENHLDLTKKLTETLSVSLQEEIRRNIPGGSVADLTRLKLLFGLDF